MARKPNKPKMQHLGVTKPIQAFNPVPKSQIKAFCEYIKANPAIDPMGMKFLIWLISKSSNLALSTWTLIPVSEVKNGKVIYEDIKRLVSLWHINLVIKCMGSAMKITCWESLHDPEGWVFQISTSKAPDEDASQVSFDPIEIAAIVL